MSSTQPIEEPGTVAEDLIGRASALIERSRQFAAAQVNAALARTYWEIGRLISGRVLGGVRAPYGREILATLARGLTARYGRGFDEQTLRRMVQFAQVFPDEQILATLWRELSWSHFRELLPVKSDEARLFYALQTAEAHLSVRELQGIIARKAYERREIANSQITTGSAVPQDTFRDPYILDFLSLGGAFQEQDLESAIVHDLEDFLLEVGQGWAFVARQKRIPFDSEDYYLDLLFFARPLRRLVAVELKLGRFRPAYKGQMDFYLKWLNRYERGDAEESPIGLILCAEVSRDQVELLEMDKDGILVAEYWSVLPPRQEFEAKLREIMRQARDRVTRRVLPPAPGESGCTPG